MRARLRSVLTVCVVLAVVAAPSVAFVVPTAAQSTPTVSIDAPDTVENGVTANGPLVVENVAAGDDIGAFKINITYNASAVSIDASDTDHFTVSTSTPESGTLTVVGYTSETDTPDGALALAALDITGEQPTDATAMSMDVETLSDTDGNSVPHSSRAETLTVTESSTEDGDGDDGTDGGTGPGGGGTGPGGGGTGPGGGGGGAGEGDTEKPTGPLQTTVSQPSPNQVAISITNLSANTPTDVTLPRTDVDNSTGTQLSGVSVNARIATNVSVSIDRSEQVPEGTPAIEESQQAASLGYFTITADVQDTDLNEVTYTFEVSKSRIEEAEITPRGVRLFRLDEGDSEWTTLATTVREEREDTYVFTASSPGFSVYAIGYNTAQEPTTTSQTTTAPVETTDMDSEETTEEATTVIPTTPGSSSDGFPTNLVAGGVVILVVAALLYYSRRGS